MWQQRWMWILWPAFLMAGVLEIVVFAFFDPNDLHWMGEPVKWSRNAVYSVAFFAFWAITSVSSALTTLLSMSPFEVNRCPVHKDDRPDCCGR
jgi:hypothetical protein